MNYSLHLVFISKAELIVCHSSYTYLIIVNLANQALLLMIGTVLIFFFFKLSNSKEHPNM